MTTDGRAAARGIDTPDLFVLLGGTVAGIGLAIVHPALLLVALGLGVVGYGLSRVH